LTPDAPPVIEVRALLAVAEWVREHRADPVARRPPGKSEGSGPGAAAYRVGGPCADPTCRSGPHHGEHDDALSRGPADRGAAS
jgi:hypothetical protein